MARVARSRLSTLTSRIGQLDQRTALPAPKVADQHYATPEHKAWRQGVLKRAGFRCERVEDGRRCRKSAANGDRLFADHIKEKKDGGDLLDPANGQALCGKHHTVKTIEERDKRMAAPTPIRK